MKKDWDKDFMSDEDIYFLYQKDKDAALDVLCRKYNSFVFHMSHAEYPTFKKNIEDMYQSGMEGLILSMRTFDPKKGKIPTYGNNFIKKEFSRQVRFDVSGGESEYFYMIHCNIAKAKAYLESIGQEPTVEAVMELTNLSYKVVSREMNVDYTTASFDLLANSDFEPEATENAIAVVELLSGLSDYERNIVRMYVLESLSFEYIGEQVGKDKYVVEQDYNDAIEKLKKQLKHH